MLSYCVYDKKTTANVPGSEKQRLLKTARNTLYLCVPSVVKKSQFFYQKSNATSIKYIFVS